MACRPPAATGRARDQRVRAHRRRLPLNAQGVPSASNLDHLHHANPTASPSRPRSARGASSSRGRGDTANEHDIRSGRAPTVRRSRRSGHPVKSVDAQHRRLGHRRPPRPHRPAAGALGPVLELLAPDRGLQPGGADPHRRVRALLPLRRQLRVARRSVDQAQREHAAGARIQCALVGEVRAQVVADLWLRRALAFEPGRAGAVLHQ